MVDPSSLMFDPNAVGGQPSGFTAPAAQPAAPAAPGADQGDPNAIWARIQDAAKRGLISQAQVDQIAQKMGYSKNQPAAPNIAGAGANVGSQIGSAAGNIVGKVGKFAANQFDKMQPPDSGASSIEMAPQPTPSPQWNQ